MQLLLSAALRLIVFIASCKAYFVTVCEDQVLQISCPEAGLKIFIEYALHGRSDNITCMPTSEHSQSCNSSIDLSWKVMPVCQGKTSCQLSANYENDFLPCGVNSSGYLNVSYRCDKINETLMAENEMAEFTCPKGEVFVVHELEWRGFEYLVPNNTNTSGSEAINGTRYGTISYNVTTTNYILRTISTDRLENGTSGISLTRAANVHSESYTVAPSSISSTSGSVSSSLSSFLSSSSLAFLGSSISVFIPSSQQLKSSSSLSSSSSSSSLLSSASPSASASASLSPPSSLSSSSSASSSASSASAPASASLSPSSSLSSSSLLTSLLSSSSLLLLASSSLDGTVSLSSSPASHLPYVSLSSLALLMPQPNDTGANESAIPTRELKPAKIFILSLLNCRGKRVCEFNVTKKKFGNPYGEKKTKLWLAVRHTCQPELGGYLQWESWSACPSVCGVRYHQVRRRTCVNPPTRYGGADCSGPQSETKSTSCYTDCTALETTACYLGNTSLACSNDTFININSIFYGEDQGACNASNLMSGSCSPTKDMEYYNSAKVYDHCQMRNSCSVVVSNDTFLDPCPGYSKFLKIQYTCSPIFTRTFCDNDNVLISCPGDKRLVFHNTPFYGSQSHIGVCGKLTNVTDCNAELDYDDLDDFCSTSSCSIPSLSAGELELKVCKNNGNYLTLYHSCQKVDSIYTTWESWGSCPACGLTAQQVRWRQCISPGNEYNSLRGCTSYTLRQRRPCYVPCAEHNVTVMEGVNATITCLNYGAFETVIEIRHALYENGSCQSQNGSKLAVMKQCQGRRECSVEFTPAMALNDSCPGLTNQLNVTYTCQPIYELREAEFSSLVPKDLYCYDNMVIVTHYVDWSNRDCAGDAYSYKAILRSCNGRSNCTVHHDESRLGNPCPIGTSSRLRLQFKMLYSCQTAYGGLDTEWGSWSNCTECGHTPVKKRVKPCLSPVTASRGAHCPLIQQVTPCNYPCPVVDLSFIKDSVVAALGQVLSIEWKLRLGTNVTAVITWGDNSINGTVSDILANATSPFMMRNEHNYSTEGDYVITVYAYNFFSNQTVWLTAHVQVILVGLSFNSPAVIATNQSSLFNISLNVTSHQAPSISFSFGDGSVFTSTSFVTNYSYTHSGVFMTDVTAQNYVSKLRTYPRRIIVQDTIQDFRVDKQVYLVALGQTLRVYLFLTTGTNVTINATFGDCELPALTTTLSAPSFFSVALSHRAVTPDVCHVFVDAWNMVSRANVSALLISEAAIQGFNATIQCQTKFPSCFQLDKVIVIVKVANGTRPKFAFEMGDGSTFTSTNRSLVSSLVYTYSKMGSFHVNISAYNNVSRRNTVLPIQVAELLPLEGVGVICNTSVSLVDLTVCRLEVLQGTAFQCVLNLGVEERSIVFMYYNLTSSISYNYTSYGVHTVQFMCNNSISSASGMFVTKVAPKTLDMTINNSGPVMAATTVTLGLTAQDTEYNSCYLLDFGDGVKVLFGLPTCASEYASTSSPVLTLTHPYMEYNYTYTEPGTYNVTWMGNNSFDSLTVYTVVVVTRYLCRVPTITLENIATNPTLATTIFRSKQFSISAKYDVNCSEASGASINWKIYKNVTGHGFVFYSTKETVTSQLLLEPNELEYGLYHIEMTLTLYAYSDVSSSVDGYLIVTASELYVDIQEGSASLRMVQSAITVNASGSRDPDTPDQSSLQFIWFCYNVTDTYAKFSTARTPLSSFTDILSEDYEPPGCFDQDPQLAFSGPVISLPREKITKGDLYVIQLLLRKGNRESRKATVIQTTGGVVPNLQLRCKVNCRNRVITTDILSISSSCSSGNCTVTQEALFVWELYQRPRNLTGLLNWTKVQDLDSMMLSSPNARNLVLREKTLKPETAYVIRLWHGSSPNRGLTEYSFITSMPPFGGNCSVTPEEGIGLQTLFTFTCDGWQTKSSPLQYTVYYLDPYTRLNSTLYQTEQNSFSAKLPPGDPSEGRFNLLIQFSCIDFYGDRTVVERSVKVSLRDFQQSEFDRLVLNDDSELDFYLNIGDISSASELISGILSKINHQSTYPTNDSIDYDKNIAVQIRYSVIKKVYKIPTQTLPAVNHVATMIAAAAEVREEVNETAQALATEKLEDMIEFLVNQSQTDIAVSDVITGVENLITAVFNVLSSAAYSADFQTQDVQHQAKTKELAYRNLEAFDRVSLAVFNLKLSGEEDTEIPTKSAILTCRRSKKTEVFKRPIKAGNSSVQFPAAVEQFVLDEEYVDIQLLLLPIVPFTWDESFLKVTSSVLDIKIWRTTKHREIVNVSNSSEEIDLQIPTLKPMRASNPDMYFVPVENGSIQYHFFEVEETNEAVEFNIKPVDDIVKLAVLVKYGRKPTTTDFDLKVELPHHQNCSSIDEPETSSCTESPYGIYLPTSYLISKGIYFVGVMYGNTSVHSRERRDCGGGGRSKRDCIKYKDPPTTIPPNGEYVQSKETYDRTRHANYTMEQLVMGCNFWNPSANAFSSAGCRSGRRRTMSRTLTCRCKHLTAFGGGVFVKPNPIDFNQVWKSFADLPNNMAVLATIITIFLLYLLVLVWARRADIRDIDSQEGEITLGKPTNGASYTYVVKISTSKTRNAGTTANVYLIVVGETGSSGTLPLTKMKKVKFTRGSLITCTAHLPTCLGPLLYLHIWHDNAGESPSWNLDHVIIHDTQTNEIWNFLCSDWLAVENDGRTDKVLYHASAKDLANYKHLFLSNGMDGLYDGHLWISVVAKPPNNYFTRVQRSSCCLSILFSTMITSAMFYDQQTVDTSSAVVLGPLKITIREVMIGIQSSLIIFPINLALTHLFRKSSEYLATVGKLNQVEASDTSSQKQGKLRWSYTTKLCRRNSAVKYFSANQALSTSSLNSNLSESLFKDKLIISKSILNLQNPCSEKQRRKVVHHLQMNKTYYCYLCLYLLAWILCFVSVFTAASFTLIYSLQWGSERSQQWLLSFFVSFIQDAAVSQPVKIAIVSAVVALTIKFSMEQGQTFLKSKGTRATRNNSSRISPTNEVLSDDEISVVGSRPPKQVTLRKARIRKMKEMKSSEVMKDVAFYGLFLFLLLVVSYGHRDPVAYDLTYNIQNIFSLSGKTQFDIWAGILYIIPNLFAGSWYNGMELSATEKAQTSDRASVLVGMARLRQLRVRSDSCATEIPLVSYLVKECYGLYNMIQEDTNIYQPNWVPVPEHVPVDNITYGMCPKPWRYHTATELKGVPMWGETTVYSGGGYVAELGYYPAKAKDVIEELANYKWIDLRTRGVFMEFTVYNAQVNLFSVITLLAEFLPTGGAITFHRIDTIRVYRYLGELSNVTLAAELTIILVIVFFLYKVIKKFYHQRVAFFKTFWNIVDLLQVIFALISFALYFVKMKTINAAMQDLSANPFVFVNFSLLLTWDQIDNVMMGLVVFLTTIKFLYLLRYNTHIRLLARTFHNMRYELFLFTVQFAFWFVSFVVIAHVTFSSHLEDFMSFPSSFQAMLNAVLGASYFHDLEAVDRIIGPALFFIFSILMELILLNMFVSIINAAFGDRKLEDENSETDPELAEFLAEKLQEILGVSLLNMIRKKEEERWYVDDSSDEGCSYRTKNVWIKLKSKVQNLQIEFAKALNMEEEEEVAEERLLRMIIREHRSSLSSSSTDSERFSSSLSSQQMTPS